MRYAQIKSGGKLHLVYDPGEGHGAEIVRAGTLSQPLCGTHAASYRMTCNVPLAHACRRCRRVHNARRRAP